MRKQLFKSCRFLFIGVFFFTKVFAQADTVYFKLSLLHPETHTAHVIMQYKIEKQPVIKFKMPQWTPGYYQVMNYANNVSNFSVADDNNKTLSWSKASLNTWAVQTGNAKQIIVQYDVLANKAFVANSIIDSAHAYLTPAATFLYPDSAIQTPVLLNIQLYSNWSRIATGLDSVADKTFTAPDFDVLYDCPLLAGNLEEFPSFTVNGILHRFIAYNSGAFDKVAFMHDIKRIVETGTNIIGDIPYKHYTFLGIGPGNGGIEHLTSSANSFTGEKLNTYDGRKRMLSFLAHEYFHNYNVKRIRPVELGPFNYDSGSKTKQLWISEGWTVYYEYLILKRATIIADTDLYKFISTNMRAYENHDGKNHQSLAQASEETWSDGPFGNDPDKTISYYDKGPVIALMLDFAIRHSTNNKQSLDDVMRKLYKNYYKEKKRGFTEDEFRNVCETVAGTKLNEIFDYVYTTKEPDYKKYFNYGGLNVAIADASFTITPLSNPDVLQSAILQSWLRGK